MSRIAIVSAANPTGDAVGYDVRHMEALLGGQGHATDVFTRVWGPDEPRNRHGTTLRRFVHGDPTAVVIYHHTSGWEEAVRLMGRLGCRRVVRYHNVTPAHFFDPYNDILAGHCREGREQVAELARAGCELYLSDSSFNQSELLAAGAPPGRCAVVPPFHQTERLVRAVPDPGVLRDCAGVTNWLFVGRRAPNKGHRLLIDAFAAYVAHFNPHSRLILLGRSDSRLRPYDEALRDQVRRLRLRGRIAFLSATDDAGLRAYYDSSAALVVASEHEGFCVPVIEAMALGVPLVARAATAVAETAGAAALVWDEADPLLLAASADRLARDPAARRFLAECGRRCYHDRFRISRLEADFLAVLGPLCRRAA
jgi:glycosyltransferase involved in cell wall biosynthesis